MELRIGVVHTPKELSVELEGTADEIVAMVESAVKDGSAMVWVTDVKGRRLGIPASKIAYVEVDEDGANKRVGFGR
jgi:Protein of unknown function (DUF3107)